MDNENLKVNLVKNLISFRKLNKLTQVELAEKLNYSDKTISKWERGEAFPDIFVLNEIAFIYKISIDDLLKENTTESFQPNKIRKSYLSKMSKNLITLLSFGLVWLIATIVFASLKIFTNMDRLWLTVGYAVPISLLVVYIFSRIWGNNLLNLIFLTGFIWTFTVCFYLTFNQINLWLLFIITAVFQILVLLWFMLKQEKFKNKLKQAFNDNKLLKTLSKNKDKQKKE